MRDVQRLLTEGTIELELKDYINDASHILKNGCEAFTKQLTHGFCVIR